MKTQALLFVTILLASSLAVAAGCASGSDADKTVFKVGDTEESVINRIPPEARASCFHQASLTVGGDKFSIYDSGFTYAGDLKSPILVFKNGTLFNIVGNMNWEKRAAYYECAGVPYDPQDYDFGPPLDYAKMILDLAAQTNGGEWSVWFSTYGKEAHVDWGLAAIAAVFKVIEYPGEWIRRTKGPQKTASCEPDWREAAYDSQTVNLGEMREEVERRLRREAVDTDANGICTYVGDSENPWKYVVLVKYDADSRVEAVFHRDFRSRALMKKLKCQNGTSFLSE